MTTNNTLAERGGAAVAHDWLTAPATGLEEAIARFKADLPGWWFTVGECQVSCDASCAPTRDSEHIGLADSGGEWDSGFHADLPQPSTLAKALDDVRAQALQAIRELPKRGGTGEEVHPLAAMVALDEEIEAEHPGWMTGEEG